MAKTFKNFKDMFKYIEKNVVDVMDDVGEEVKKIIEKYIMENVYKNYSPTHYSRTFEYLDSLSISDIQKEKNGYSITLFFDTDKIHPYYPDKPGNWSSHMSITSVAQSPRSKGYGGGNDKSEMIPYWIEFGVTGSLWDREGAYPVQFTKNELYQTKKHVKKLKELLEKKGFKVKFK